MFRQILLHSSLVQVEFSLLRGPRCTLDDQDMILRKIMKIRIFYREVGFAKGERGLSFKVNVISLVNTLSRGSISLHYHPHASYANIYFALA